MLRPVPHGGDVPPAVHCTADATRSAGHTPGTAAAPITMLWALDVIVCVVAWLCIGSFCLLGLAMPAAVTASLWIGSFALALLAGYPLQLALFGDAWWRCVQARYPLQAVAMVSYIYVPTTWAFAVILTSHKVPRQS